MSATSHRHERIGEEIAHEINAMLAGELKDPRLEGHVSVSEVRVQPDMKHARIFIVVRSNDSKEQNGAIKALEHASGYIVTNSSSVCKCGVCLNFISRSTIPKRARFASNNCSRK